MNCDFLKKLFLSSEFFASLFGVLLAFLINYIYIYFKDKKVYRSLLRSIARELNTNLANYQENNSAISFESFKRISGHPIFSNNCPDEFEAEIWDVYSRLRKLKEIVGSVKPEDRKIINKNIIKEISDFKLDGYETKLINCIERLKK